MPAPILVTEDWSVRTWTKFTSAQRVFQVGPGVTSEQAAIDAVVAYDGTTDGGESYVADSTIFVPSQNGQTVARNGRLYIVTVNWASSNPNGSGKNPKDLDKPLKLSMEWEISDEEHDRDPDGNPIVNTNFDPFATGKKKRRRTAILVYKRFESTFDLAKYLQFTDKYNSDIITLPGINGNILPRQAYLDMYAINGEIEPSTVEAVPVIYKIKLRNYLPLNGNPIPLNPIPGIDVMSGFDIRTLDQGVRGTALNGKVGQFTDAKGQKVHQPIRLYQGMPFDDDAGYKVNGEEPQPQLNLPDGAVYDVLDNAAYILYRGPDEMPFAGLTIA